MGVFADMLPEIRARERTDAILRFTGCKALKCSLAFHEQMWEHGVWVEHNGERQFFPMKALRHRHDGCALVVTPGTMDLVATIPFEVLDWLEADHALRWDRLHAEQVAAIYADPWRAHAAMVSLS